MNFPVISGDFLKLPFDKWLAHCFAFSGANLHSLSFPVPCRIAGIIDATTPASKERIAVDNKINR